jgi:hypothetical protein|tara:strand:+ start:5598 stop:5840 length:243 start_codon:yes stop_codon:yes gene_type:complete
MYISLGDRMLLRKLSMTTFSKSRNLKEKNDNVNKSKSKTIYYQNHNKIIFEKFNINVNKLKPTHSGGGIIIQPGGGYKGN